MNNNLQVCVRGKNGIIPTRVLIQSIVNSCADKESIYHVYVVSDFLNGNETGSLKSKVLESGSIIVDIINIESYYEQQNTAETQLFAEIYGNNLKELYCLTKLFPDIDKIVYLNDNVLIKCDLKELWEVCIENCYVATAINCKYVYDQQSFNTEYLSCFDTSIMVLNLKSLREMFNVFFQCDLDVEQKTEIYNINDIKGNFAKKICNLPIRYDFMPDVLNSRNSDWSIDQINVLYGTQYKNKKQLYSDAAILNYPTEVKPWTDPDCACASEWLSVYKQVFDKQTNDKYGKGQKALTVIMSCFNTEQYIKEALDSILCQTFQNYEIICIDDGSTDATLNILRAYETKYKNICVISDSNHGQGYQRNVGIDYANGKYLYFMDSDDVLCPDCFEVIYNCAEQNDLDLVYFEATSFYETKELEERFPEYKYCYDRREAYPRVYDGKELYIKFRNSGELIVSPTLQFIKKSLLTSNNIRFPQLPLYEDNLYTFQTILHAKRVKCLGYVLYYRRVRDNSIMTASKEPEKIESLTIIIQETLKELIKYEESSPLYLAIAMHLRVYLKRLYSMYNAMDDVLRNDLLEIVPCEQWELLLLSLPVETMERKIKEMSAYLKEERVNKKRMSNELRSVRENLKITNQKNKELNAQVLNLNNIHQHTLKQLNEAKAREENLNSKLHLFYEEKSGLNKKLQVAYNEKSEINKKLQITYKEKYERGLEIKRLQEELRIEKENCSFIKVLKNNYFRIKKYILLKINNLITKGV